MKNKMNKLFKLANNFQIKLAEVSDETPPTLPPDDPGLKGLRDQDEAFQDYYADEVGPETEREPGGSSAWQQEGRPLVVAKSLFEKARLQLQHFKVLAVFVSRMGDEDLSGYNPDAIKQWLESLGLGYENDKNVSDLQAVIAELEELEQGIEDGKQIIKLL